MGNRGIDGSAMGNRESTYRQSAIGQSVIGWHRCCELAMGAISIGQIADRHCRLAIDLPLRIPRLSLSIRSSIKALDTRRPLASLRDGRALARSAAWRAPARLRRSRRRRSARPSMSSRSPFRSWTARPSGHALGRDSVRGHHRRQEAARRLERPHPVRRGVGSAAGADDGAAARPRSDATARSFSRSTPAASNPAKPWP